MLRRLGTEEQKQLGQGLVEQRWGATMVLTEPDAGSDVGAGRTKAVAAARRHLAHHRRQALHHLGRPDDLFDNILHFVLARPEGAGPGTKGLSLFIVPKFHFDSETGELGERNGAFVTNLEHKMGLKASDHVRPDLRRPRSPGQWAGWSATSTRASRRCST